GAIAVSIAVNVKDASILATDISPKALQVAKRNAQKYGVEDRIKFIKCDLLPTHHPRLDLLCANLPYIPTDILHTLPVYGREPTLALDGGADGLNLVRNLMGIVATQLSP